MVSELSTSSNVKEVGTFSVLKKIYIIEKSS
jgi:hypothetical protein